METRKQSREQNASSLIVPFLIYPENLRSSASLLEKK
jgi:hypothetical protein